jgi:hypothetical protein
MKIKENLTKGRIVAYAISCILPLLAMGLGILMLFNGMILNLSFLVVMIVFPVVTFALLFGVIISKWKIIPKIIVAVLILLIFGFLFLSGLVIGYFETLSGYEGTEAIEYYSSAPKRSLLPSLDEVGQPEKIEYFEYFNTKLGIFTNDVPVLICQYSALEYETQKALLEETYTFQSEEMTASRYSCNPTVKIGDYVFRTLAIDGTYAYAIDYPKCMYFIAYNDHTQEIVYLSSYDDDLDFIRSLEEFLTEDCGWKYMR